MQHQIIFLTLEFNKELYIFIMKNQQQNESATGEIYDLEEELEQQNQKQNGYIIDSHEFLKFCQSQKKIKLMDQCNPIFNNVYLKDISLHKKGPLEDKIYAKINKYYKNIRRGNTLCQIFKKNQNNQNSSNNEFHLFFCRRGMKKFYDLEPEYLKIQSKLSTYHMLMKKRIFQGIEAEIQISLNTKFHLYRLFKQNGQHCQISYIKQLQSWLFASKNVAILARQPQDLEMYYLKERFYWAKLVGVQFFNILKQFTTEKQEQFKKQIDGFTLLGEHCGYEKHQHITKYSKIEIIFYGLVQNVGINHCEPVDKCKTFLQKYGLKMSQCFEKRNIETKSQIYQTMYEWLKQIGQGTMADKGEGSVLYIVAEHENSQKTVSMCKLKTCEYLIYRKLRQMLKLNLSRKGMTSNTFEKYKFQIENLVQHYFKPPQPINYYFRLAQAAFKEINIKQNQIDDDYLRYKFVQFLQRFNIQEKQEKDKPKKPLKSRKIMLICLPRFQNTIEKFCKKNNIDVQYMYRTNTSKDQEIKTTLYILHMIPRLPAKLDAQTHILIPNYSPDQINKIIAGLKEYKDLSKSHLITFVKSENKQKNIQMLYDKIISFKKACQEQQIPFRNIDCLNLEENTIQAINSFATQDNKQNQIKIKPVKFYKYFLLPLLIPGSGKTTLAKYIQTIKTDNFKIKVLSSDEMRRQLMQKYGDVDLNCLSSNSLFMKTRQEALQTYRTQYLFKQIKIEPTLSNEIVFIDRAFSPSTLVENIEQILSFKKDYIKIIVLNQKYHPIILNNMSYPYSLKYLLVCLKRCLQRQGHLTMPNDPYEATKIVLKFYQMMFNLNEREVTQKKQLRDKVKFLSLSFVNDQDDKVNQFLKKKIEEVLRLIQPPNYECKDSNSYLELVQLMYKYQSYLEQKPIESQILANQILSACFVE